MLSRLLIIASGGLLCYSKAFTEGVGVDDDLVSGFLTAISNFAREIKGGDIRSLNFKNFNFVYEYDEPLDCMFIIVIDIDDPADEAQEKVLMLKEEFLKRFRSSLENWSGDVTQFVPFNEYVEEHIFLPPKVLLVGEPGVGKTTIMELFPGELCLNLDEDLNEILEKPINVNGLKGLKQFLLREIDLEDLVDNSKMYRPLLDSVEVVIIVTNSAASNLGRTKKLFGTLKKKVKRAEFFVIANFQDHKDSAFDPVKIQEAFEVPTYGFSAIGKDAKKEMFELMVGMMKIAILDKIVAAEKEMEG